MSTRKIIDPKQNGEKVWLKSHAQATFMSDGSTVEDAINNIEIPSLDDYVTETELNDKGFLTKHQDISHLASKDDVYDSISNIDFYTIKDNPVLNTEDGKLLFVDESGNIGLQLENDRLYVSDVVAGDHILSNKADIDDIPSLDGYAKTSDIPSLDGYAKTEDLPNFDEFAKTEDIPSLDGYAKTEDIPSVDIFVKSEDLPNFDEFAKTEDIPSLDGYAKTEDIPSLDGYASKEWVNNRNYATEYDLKTIDYSSINNVPVSEDETGELNIADESGNIGMKVASEAVYAKDFVAGEHKLSEKVDANKIATINGKTLTEGGNIEIGGKEYVKKEIGGTGGLSFNEYEPLEPNKVYYCTDQIKSIHVDGITPPTNDVAEYLVYFTTENIGMEPSEFLSSLLWANGDAPTIEGGVTYELSIVATKLGGNYIYKAVLTPFKQIL